MAADGPRISHSEPSSNVGSPAFVLKNVYAFLIIFDFIMKFGNLFWTGESGVPLFFFRL